MHDEPDFVFLTYVCKLFTIKLIIYLQRVHGKNKVKLFCW